jgi:hypothetical protein
MTTAKKHTFTAATLIVGVSLVFGAIIFATDSDGATRTLQQQGYTNIVITGPRPLSKGQDDLYSTGFEATSPSGARVTGVVTRGLFKGSTIRFD